MLYKRELLENPASWPDDEVYNSKFLHLIRRAGLGAALCYAVVRGCDYGTNVKGVGTQKTISILTTACAEHGPELLNNPEDAIPVFANLMLLRVVMVLGVCAPTWAALGLAGSTGGLNWVESAARACIAPWLRPPVKPRRALFPAGCRVAGEAEAGVRCSAGGLVCPTTGLLSCKFVESNKALQLPELGGGRSPPGFLFGGAKL